jgi:hypothetical protein
MTNTSTPPTLAERLAKVPTGALTVRLSLARTRFAYAQTSYARAKAMDEIDAVKAELMRRQHPTVAE